MTLPSKAPAVLVRRLQPEGDPTDLHATLKLPDGDLGAFGVRGDHHTQPARVIVSRLQSDPWKPVKGGPNDLRFR